MGVIKIPYNGNDIELHKLGDRILYYTEYRNFIPVQAKTNASIETQVKCQAIPTYKKIDGEYIATNNFSESIEYYVEDGTLEIDCPACGNQSGKPGYLKGDDEKYYLCPRCDGKGKLVATIIPSPIISLNVSQHTLDETGYSITYRVVPNGKVGSDFSNMTSIVIDDDKFIDKASFDIIINYWENLINILKEEYRTSKDMNDNFFNNVLDDYNEKLQQLKELI